MPRIPVTIPQNGQAAASPLAPAQPFEYTPTRAGIAIQTNARAASRPADASPFGDGNLLTGVSFVAGTPIVLNHGLARAYRGFFVLNMSGGAGVVQVIAQAPSARNAATITLQSSANCSADVWVY